MYKKNNEIQGIYKCKHCHYIAVWFTDSLFISCAHASHRRALLVNFKCISPKFK